MARKVKDPEERKQELLDTAMHLCATRGYSERRVALARTLTCLLLCLTLRLRESAVNVLFIRSRKNLYRLRISGDAGA